MKTHRIKRHTCVICGMVWTGDGNRCLRCGQMEIEQVTPFTAAVIIDTREPRGKFWTTDESGMFVGIDNEHGEAWTEEFDNQKKCLKWLRGERKNEQKAN